MGSDSLLGTTTGAATAYRCANCGAAMADDQRYCVECGTRRGKPRFSLQGADAPATAAKASGAPAGRSAAPSAMVVALVVAVVLALGVGFLIGHDSNSTTSSGAPAALSTGSGAAGSGNASSSNAASSHGGSGGRTAKTSGSSNTSGNERVGGPCKNGTAGCQNGKFTGNFFGS